MRKKRRAVLKAFDTYLPLVPFFIFALFPFYFMLITSFKKNSELYDLDSIPFLIREGFTLEHYKLLLYDTPFLIWFKNTVIVSLLTTGMALVIALLAAYSIARMKFKGVEFFGVAVFVTYLVPPSLMFLPMNQVIVKLGLSDSIWSLVVTYPTFLVPFLTWLMMGYFRTIPREIEECAMIDGCTRLQTFIRIVIPVAKPAIITSALFAFTMGWHEFLYALTFLSSTTSKVVTVGVTAELIRGDIYYWGSLMAGAVLGAVPVVFVYIFLMDYYVSGLTAGAIK
jgi:multiple sugar transport system permease protein